MRQNQSLKRVTHGTARSWVLTTLQSNLAYRPQEIKFEMYKIGKIPFSSEFHLWRSRRRVMVVAERKEEEWEKNRQEPSFKGSVLDPRRNFVKLLLRRGEKR